MPIVRWRENDDWRVPLAQRAFPDHPDARSAFDAAEEEARRHEKATIHDGEFVYWRDKWGNPHETRDVPDPRYW